MHIHKQADIGVTIISIYRCVTSEGRTACLCPSANRCKTTPRELVILGSTYALYRPYIYGVYPGGKKRLGPPRMRTRTAGSYRIDRRSEY